MVSVFVTDPNKGRSMSSTSQHFLRRRNFCAKKIYTNLLRRSDCFLPSRKFRLLNWEESGFPTYLWQRYIQLSPCYNRRNSRTIDRTQCLIKCDSTSTRKFSLYNLQSRIDILIRDNDGKISIPLESYHAFQYNWSIGLEINFWLPLMLRKLSLFWARHHNRRISIVL